MKCGHNWPLRLAAVAFVAGMMVSPGKLRAALLFDDGTGNFSHSYSADTGAGQEISVATTTDLTNIGVDLALPNGGDVKFLVFDGTDSTLLYATTPEILSPSTMPAYAVSPAFNFTLSAGSNYFFGYIADAISKLNVLVPCPSVSQNGLGIAGCQIDSYSNYANPAGAGLGYFMTDMTLQLFGAQSAPPVSEPAGVVIIASGLLALGVIGAVRSGRCPRARHPRPVALCRIRIGQGLEITHPNWRR